MTIWLDKDNNQLPARPKYIAETSTSNPTDEQLLAVGIRPVQAPGCDRKYWLAFDGTAFPEMSQEQKDAVDAAEAQAAIDAEAARQAGKSKALKAVENAFFDFCDLLGFQEKPGFAALNTVIGGMVDQQQAAALAIRLLAIDAEGKREGGLNWWDDAQRHV